MNVLIVEDETHTARFLKDVIEQEDDFLVVDILDSIVAAVNFLAKYQSRIDLIFLDIQLSDGASFEIFKHIDIYVPVIFCTAYNEYTLQAIKNNGIDYILKPFEDAEVHQALQKYKRLVGTLNKRNAAGPISFIAEKKSYQETFLAQIREKSVVVETAGIALYAIEYETVYLYTFKGERYPLFKNMDYIESVIDSRRFFRVNRQMIVNRDAVISLEPYFNRKVILHLKITCEEKVIVSRLKVPVLKEWLERGGSPEI